MNTWTPIFSKLVDSSIWDEPDYVCKIWVTLLAKKDADQIVRATAYMIGNWSRKTEKEVLDALKVLSSPDRKRLEPQPFEGRRIEKCEDGWRILNGQTYEDLMRSINRREYKAKKEREYRLKKNGPPLRGEPQAVAAERDGASPEQQDQIVTDHLPVPQVPEPAAIGALVEYGTGDENDPLNREPGS